MRWPAKRPPPRFPALNEGLLAPSKVWCMRRVTLALGISFAVHVAIVLASFAVAAWRGFSLAPKIDVVPITIESIKELPLGPPPSAAPPPAVVQPRPKAVHRGGTVATGRADAGAPDARPETPDVRPPDVRIAKPGDLSASGPDGSRLTALLRLDRLRAAPEARTYISSVDEILRLLPDRRRLLDGTGLDMYRDFDSLVIATPNPFDDTVTFLAVRHHVTDERLREGLSRSAEAHGRPIAWHDEGGRPVGIRGRSDFANSAARADRDDRIFVLPAPGIAVIAPPAYAKLLLQTAPPAGTTAPRRDWTELVTRIDAEAGSLPDDAVFMMTATNLLRAAGLGRGDARTVPAGAPAALPKVLSVIAGASPVSFVQVVADFETAADAAAWEKEWPVWKQKLLGNPLLLLTGLSPILVRIETERDGRKLSLRTTASPEETRRVLQLIVTLSQGRFSRP